MLTESFALGANISAVARPHGVSCGLLHCWRKQALGSAAILACVPALCPLTMLLDCLANGCFASLPPVRISV
jgi:hypothetical protein